MHLISGLCIFEPLELAHLAVMMAMGLGKPYCLLCFKLHQDLLEVPELR